MGEQSCPEGYKRCNRCGECYPATTEYFRAEKHCRGGLLHQCKSCVKKQQHQHYLENRQKIIKRVVEYQRANPQKGRDADKRYREKHGDRARQMRRERVTRWRASNLPTAEQRERDRLRARQWYAEHTEYASERNRDYRKRQKQLFPLRYKMGVKARGHRRRARKLNLPDTLTLAQTARMYDYWGHRCAVCGQAAGLWVYLAADHWIAIADPRPDNPGTVATNMIPLCHTKKDAPAGKPYCNNSKGFKDPIEWLTEYLGERKAKAKLREIEAYFEWVRQQDE